MLTISVVLPLYEALDHLPSVLPPLVAALEEGTVLEVLIVDDGSTDGGPDYCRGLGLEPLETHGPLGPAAARNLGVDSARGDIVLFVDSDTIMRPEVPSIVRATFESEPDCVAVFGSYDDRPPKKGYVSQYVNLRHHYTHQQGAEEASTFWAGSGAVDRRIFMEVGGFDATRYPRPSIEDIELGYRLRRRGRILLRKNMQCRHLKRWTLRSMIMTDVFDRALPWSRILLGSKRREGVLNVTPAERLKAVLAGLIAVSLLAGAFHYPLLGVTGALLVAAFFANRRFFQLVGRRGPAHLLAALALHQLYYVYSTLVYAYCLIEVRVLGRRADAEGGLRA